MVSVCKRRALTIAAEIVCARPRCGCAQI